MSLMDCADEEVGVLANRNSYAFISCLPTETLESIFIHYARDYYEHLREKHGRLSVPIWVNVSYVCHRWRNVALNCAVLWTYHFMVSRRWTEELLVRSRQAPLKIRLNGYTQPWWFDLLEKVLDHIERIQDLSLHVPKYGIRELLPKLSSRAPYLQSLEIWADDYHSVCSVPFCGDTPSLRTLELQCCPVPWYSLNLSSLTSLALGGVPAPLKQGAEDFLATLCCMHGLTCLYLEDALRSSVEFLSSATFHNFQKVNLPHLSSLFISAPVSTVVAFLSCTNFPLKTPISLECDQDHDFRLEDFALLSSAVAQRFSLPQGQALTCPIIRSAIVDLNTMWGGVVVKLSAAERDCSPELIDPRNLSTSNVCLQITMTFNLPLASRDVTEWITRDFICSLPLITTVGSVHVLHPPLSPKFWRRIFGHLQCLRVIKLSNGDIPDLSVLARTDLAINERAEDEDRHAPSDLADHVLVPGLEELELDRITFLQGDCSNMQGSTSTYQRLLDVLSTRNCSQGRLTVTDCKMGKSDMLDSVRSWDDVDNHVVGE